MRIVLASMHMEPSPRAVPLGPANLAAVLRRERAGAIDPIIIDLFLTESLDTCSERILAAKPDAVGLSIYLWNRRLAVAITRRLKESRPDLIVFAGGPEATYDHIRLLEESAIDFILTGEGEGIIVAAMDLLEAGTNPAEIPTIIPPVPMPDLARLPSPFLTGTLDTTRYSGLLWELSRGCAFLCDFCTEAKGIDSVRRFPMARVRAELDLFTATDVDQIFVLDPTFNWNKDKAKEILKYILEIGCQTHFFFEVRSEFVDDELAELFAAVSCTLQIGMQSTDKEVLKNISRGMNRKDFEKKLLMLHEAGARYGLDLIYGLPGDTPDLFRTSLDFALGLAPNHLDIFPLAVLPGTRLFVTAPSFGLEYQDHDPYHITASPTFDLPALQIATRLAASVDVFYNRGQAVPWFRMVIDALQIAPSEFFHRFASFQDARNEGAPAQPALSRDGTGPDLLNPESIIQLQREFLIAAFTEAGKPAWGRVASDIAAYLGYSTLLEEGRLHLVDEPVTRTLSFDHDPRIVLEHLEMGITDLEEIASFVPAWACEARLFMGDEGIGIELDA